MTDPISDMLTRIRNAQIVGKNKVVLPMSKAKLAIAKILEREGWLGKIEVEKGSLIDKEVSVKSKFDQLKISLKYDENGKSIITAINRVSRPGLRKYSKKTELPIVLNNLGIAIISTSQGLMTNKEAKKKGFGGEVLCEIY
jgi:small subunit ribosomal protein S8